MVEILKTYTGLSNSHSLVNFYFPENPLRNSGYCRERMLHLNFVGNNRELRGIFCLQITELFSHPLRNWRLGIVDSPKVPEFFILLPISLQILYTQMHDTDALLYGEMLIHIMHQCILFFTITNVIKKATVNMGKI